MSASSLTPLEQKVLDEYSRLLNNMNTLSESISALSTTPTANLVDSLRELERKSALVFTLLKASVYTIVLQQQLDEEQEGGREGGADGGGGGGGGGRSGEESEGGY